MQRQELINYLEELLNPKVFNDYAPNGLQVEGKDEIKRIATAVSADEESILKALSWQADALLVHHGYFWRGEAQVLVGVKRQRIFHLLANNLNLLAYHLPLDCHLDLGNNACLAKILSIEATKSHKIANIPNLLWSGNFLTPFKPHLLAKYLGSKLKRQPLHIAANKKAISSIAWCSGGAQDYIEDAARLKVDAYLSGEVSERTYYLAKELGIHYYACGHHATERYGIQALGEHLASNFKLSHLFIDSDNPV